MRERRSPDWILWLLAWEMEWLPHCEVRNIKGDQVSGEEWRWWTWFWPCLVPCALTTSKWECQIRSWIHSTRAWGRGWAKVIWVGIACLQGQLGLWLQGIGWRKWGRVRNRGPWVEPWGAPAEEELIARASSALLYRMPGPSSEPLRPPKIWAALAAPSPCCLCANKLGLISTVCVCTHTSVCVPVFFGFHVQLCVRSGCCHYAANGNTATDRNSQLAPRVIAVTASYRTARPKGMN